MIKFTRDSKAFSVEKIDKATKAFKCLEVVENFGKNATVLKAIVKAIKSKKANPTYDFYVSDGLEKAIVKLALDANTQDKALKASKYDNLFEYHKAFKAWAKTPKAEMTQEKKDNLKSVIAKAQILRFGLFSKYCHGEVSLNDLIIAHGFDVKESDQIAEDTLGLEPEQAQEQAQEQNPIVDLSELTKILNSLSLDQAVLMSEVLKGRIAETYITVENEKVS